MLPVGASQTDAVRHFGDNWNFNQRAFHRLQKTDENFCFAKRWLTVPEPKEMIISRAMIYSCSNVATSLLQTGGFFTGLASIKKTDSSHSLQLSSVSSPFQLLASIWVSGQTDLCFQEGYKVFVRRNSPKWGGLALTHFHTWQCTIFQSKLCQQWNLICMHFLSICAVLSLW